MHCLCMHLQKAISWIIVMNGNTITTECTHRQLSAKSDQLDAVQLKVFESESKVERLKSSIELGLHAASAQFVRYLFLQMPFARASE